MHFAKLMDRGCFGFLLFYPSHIDWHYLQPTYRKRTPNQSLCNIRIHFRRRYFSRYNLRILCLDEILFAVAITLGVSAALILFASQTKVDFTSKGMHFYASLWVLILLGMITPFYSGTGNLIYSGLGALIFSLYMVYDAQLILGGNTASTNLILMTMCLHLALYLDIVNLFLIILGGVGETERAQLKLRICR